MWNTCKKPLNVCHYIHVNKRIYNHVYFHVIDHFVQELPRSREIVLLMDFCFNRSPQMTSWQQQQYGWKEETHVNKHWFTWRNYWRRPLKWAEPLTLWQLSPLSYSQDHGNSLFLNFYFKKVCKHVIISIIISYLDSNSSSDWSEVHHFLNKTRKNIFSN